MLQVRIEHGADYEWHAVGLVDEMRVVRSPVAGHASPTGPMSTVQVEIAIGDVRHASLLALYTQRLGRRREDDRAIDAGSFGRVMLHEVGGARRTPAAVRAQAVSTGSGELVGVDIFAWCPSSPRMIADAWGRLVSIALVGPALIREQHEDPVLSGAGRVWPVSAADVWRPPNAGSLRD